MTINRVPEGIAFELMAPFTPHRARALALLVNARDAARETGGDLWDFAIEISSFCHVGVTVNDLRWLPAGGYLDHAVEVSRPRDASRRFRPSRNLGFHARTCFVVSEVGMRAAEWHRLQSSAISRPLRSIAPCSGGDPTSDRLMPLWDRNRRILRVGETIVKQYRVPSPSQETILIAFEEEAWPAVVDDPLPPPNPARTRSVASGLQFKA